MSEQKPDMGDRVVLDMSEEVDPGTGVLQLKLVIAMRADGSWEVEALEVPQELRGQGYGNRMLQRAMAEVVAQGGFLKLYIWTTARDLDGPTTEQIEAWLARRGWRKDWTGMWKWQSMTPVRTPGH
jgi:GNAT superfamily N-acetyltransferase